MSDSQNSSNGVFKKYSSRPQSKRADVRKREERSVTNGHLLVDAALEEIVVVKSATLNRIIQLIWVYIKSKKLQRPNNMIDIDQKLRAVIGVDNKEKKELPSKELFSCIMKYIERNLAHSNRIME